MALFKTNRDFDSTVIIFGIHLLLAGVIAVEVILDTKNSDLSSLLNNLMIVYGMICSYFFKSQSQQTGGGNGDKSP